MKKNKHRALFLFVILAFFVCCNSNVEHQKMIEESPETKIENKFKELKTEDGKSTFGNYFTKIAGLRGDVKYSIFSGEGESNPDIKIVQVDINKNETKVEYKTAMLQYQYNSKTDFIKLSYLEVNGKQQSLLEGAMMLYTMSIESLKR